MEGEINNSVSRKFLIGCAENALMIPLRVATAYLDFRSRCTSGSEPALKNGNPRKETIDSMVG